MQPWQEEALKRLADGADLQITPPRQGYPQWFYDHLALLAVLAGERVVHISPAGKDTTP